MALRLAVLLASIPATVAQGYAVATADEIRASASTLAYDMMRFYKGNQSGEIPGILPGPPTEHKGDYYWWEGGALMGTMIDYWHLTGDDTYNGVVTQGILHQVGEDRNFEPLNHTASLGNDDQGFWGMTAMLAAERRFPDPAPDQPQWLALAQAVFNRQAPRWEERDCGGGLRWQIPMTNNGYDYKNTIANACFFDLGARLARYTRNDTYADWAGRVFDWLWAVEYIDHDTWQVYDGGHVPNRCRDINKATFSYNHALLLHGSAFLYNHTGGSDVWRARVDRLTSSLLSNFFPQGIAVELPCEGRVGQCTADMLSFKGYVHRWLSVVTQVAPFTRDAILPVLRTSAVAAARQCTGGASGRQCGFYWAGGTYVDVAADKTSGAGEAMSVLAAVSSLLVTDARVPLTNQTGGTSAGNPSAGGDTTTTEPLRPVTTRDRAGAGILTLLVLSTAMGTWSWISL